MLQIEQYGFDEEVSVIVQPRLKFIDYSKTQNKTIESRVYPNLVFGTKLYIPAHLDVLVSFAPVSNLPSNPVGLSYMGRFKLRTWY